MAELSSIRFNSYAYMYVRINWIMSTTWDQYMNQDDKFDELNTLSKLSSISYKISSMSWMS